MASQLGVSQTTVHVRLEELNMKTRYIRNYNLDEQKIRKWVLDENKSAVWIAKQYKCHPSTVQLYLKKVGIPAIGNEHRGSGSESNHWKGGVVLRTGGYLAEMRKGHPRANSAGYVFQHILVMESMIGRHLFDDEVVHHKNGNKGDNNPDNLQLMKDSEHRSYHSLEIHRKRRENQQIDHEASSTHKE